MAVPIGQRLREVRLARGLSLEDVRHHTRISRTLLVAMENDDLGAFPNQTCARRFFAAYARHLGVEAGGFLRHFQPHGLGGVIQYHPYLQAPIGHTGPARRRRPPRSATTVSVILVAVLAVLVGASVWAARHDRSSAAAPSPLNVAPGTAPTATSSGRATSARETTPPLAAPDEEHQRSKTAGPKAANAPTIPAPPDEVRAQ